MKLSIATVFKALGHPTRLQIVKLIQDRERCVCELVEAVEPGWSTVSKHLSILKEAEIIEDRKQGLQVYYRVKLPCVLELITCLENQFTPARHENAKDCCLNAASKKEVIS